MKKLVLLAVMMALVMMPMMAQNVVRHGDTYMVEGQVMKKRAFADYMQAKAEAQFAAQFRSGLKVSDAGWGLFAAGLAAECGGMIMTTVGYADAVQNISEDPVPQDINPLAAGGVVCYLVGGGCVTSGIICLAVGYARMHKSADLYASSKKQAYLTPSTNGLGLALHF